MTLFDYCFLASSIRDLLKLKEEITKERDQLLSEVVTLRQNLTQATEQQQDTERAKNEAEQAVMQVCTAHRVVILGFVPNHSPLLQLTSMLLPVLPQLKPFQECSEKSLL